MRCRYLSCKLLYRWIGRWQTSLRRQRFSPGIVLYGPMLMARLTLLRMEHVRRDLLLMKTVLRNCLQAHYYNSKDPSCTHSTNAAFFHIIVKFTIQLRCWAKLSWETVQLHSLKLLFKIITGGWSIWCACCWLSACFSHLAQPYHMLTFYLRMSRFKQSALYWVWWGSYTSTTLYRVIQVNILL